MSTMWKTKTLYFAIFITLAGLAAVYQLIGTGSSSHHHHHHHNLQLNSLSVHTVSVDTRQQLPNTAGTPGNGGSDVGPKPAEPEPEGGSSGSPTTKKPLLRILVLTYKRSTSLERCLASLNAAEYDGLPVEVDIHIDRGKDDRINEDTVRVANSFVFKHGAAHVHPRARHGGVLGQWLSSWRVPRDNASEIAVFIEDDLTVSPYFARWLRKAHEKYDGYPGVNGYSMQGESIRHAYGSPGSNIQCPSGETVFLYPVLGSWGFSPNTAMWREFLRWYHEASQNPKFLPLVPGLKPSGWYQSLAKSGRGDSMWTMWHIYHAYKNHQLTLYPCLPEKKGLTFNWKEPGEHYAKHSMGKGLHAHLMETWREEDVRLPEKIVVLNAKGFITGEKISSKGLERL
ncbi:uncharacterized protein LOC143301102 [Babylonia areolata]|uniref:uncharacterized protein LOC143301102 n=1 Tax=Babylonia areolata TaxID=304850 RepID=UPI003FD341E0